MVIELSKYMLIKSNTAELVTIILSHTHINKCDYYEYVILSNNCFAFDKNKKNYLPYSIPDHHHNHQHSLQESSTVGWAFVIEGGCQWPPLLAVLGDSSRNPQGAKGGNNYRYNK